MHGLCEASAQVTRKPRRQKRRRMCDRKQFLNCKLFISMISEVAADPTVPSAIVPPRARVVKLLPLLGQLGLVLLVIRLYNVESRSFFYVAILAVAGFAVHALLPMAYRLPFFVLLSFAGVGVVFGIRDGAWLLTVGLALIGICHLPVRMGIRIALLIGVAVSCALARAGTMPAPWSNAVWPILASMFMFRLAVYVYALRHNSAAVSPARTLAYFFMLPSVCFPLFPVVDYGTFVRTYYDRADFEIYERGVQWIIRGLLHLLLYRFVYLNLTLAPAELRDLGDIVQFILATFLLYLRVSGQFHLIVGVLHLFGFRLPETHRLYYLASGFTDFWRRINIYWKDFMMTLVYYPSFFRLRRWGEKKALVGATLIVFFTTWLLHSYQWFWLRGGFPITAQDGLFWGILGTIVVVSSLRELKRGRRRSAGKSKAWNLGQGVRTALFFWVMAVLWSLWSAESVGEWLGMWLAVGNVGHRSLVLITVVTAGFIVVGGRSWEELASADGLRRPHSLRWTGGASLGALLFLAVSAYSPVRNGMPWRAEQILISLSSTTLNQRDATVQQRGYYEKLDSPSRLSAELWTVEATRPTNWERLHETPVRRRRTDFLVRDLSPGVSHRFHDRSFSTNRWGMRDRDYTLEKPLGTVRIAILGPSHVMGSGVADGEPFEALLEARLNESAGRAGAWEVMNFGVGGYSLLQELTLLDQRVLVFRPDVVLIANSPIVDQPISTHLRQVFARGAQIPYEELRAILADAGVPEYASRGFPVPFSPLRRVAQELNVAVRPPLWEADTRLQKRMDEIIAWALQHIAEASARAGATPAYMALDIVRPLPRDPAPVLRRAKQTGLVVLDLLDVYDGHDPATLRVAEWDNHPNARGHQLIADRLYVEIIHRATELGLGPHLPSTTALGRSGTSSDASAAQPRKTLR